MDQTSPSRPSPDTSPDPEPAPAASRAPLLADAPAGAQEGAPDAPGRVRPVPGAAPRDAGASPSQARHDATGVPGDARTDASGDAPTDAPGSARGGVPGAAVAVPAGEAPFRAEAPPGSPRVPAPVRAPGAAPAQPAARRRGGVLGPLLGLLVVVLLVAGALRWHPWSRGGAGRPAAGAGAPQAVAVAAATRGDMPVMLNELGTVTPLAMVTVHTQISGILQQVGFTEGQIVHRGDFLAQIDPRPYQALLAQYQGALARDQAALANARLDLQRYQLLNRQDSVARQTVDTAAATVRQDEGTVAADQGQIQTELVNLAFCRITAPVDGRVGLRQVDAGNYVTPADTNGIVVVTQIQPISVIFTLPEDRIPAVQRRTAAGASLPVTAWDRQDRAQIAAGALLTLDNQIDTSTGTVKARASFPNTDGALFPNQFVNAHLLVDTLHDQVLVPQAAVQRGTPGTFVYVLAQDDTVSVRTVTLGESDAAHAVVLKGLEPGERVVTDGTDRLREGMKVSVPADHPAPAATDAPQEGRRGEHRGRRRSGGSEP